MKKYPIGLQDFKKIIEDNCLYVDKTKKIYDLVTTGDYYFLSRPRRFGKSLLLSTLEYLFKGEKDLFKGLYIYDKWEFKEHPVVKLSMSSVTYSEGRLAFNKSLKDALKDIARQNKITVERDTLIELFKELIIKLSEKYNSKVVILIDEYDKPLVDNITDDKKARELRDVLRDFYSPIKDLDAYIKFFMLTGVSKFSKISLFSHLNNLKDITLDERFSTLVGLTEEELNKYFYTAQSAVQEKQNVKEWYNGYSFDGINRVYNPFSVLSYFDTKNLNNFWFETGTPTFLIELILKNNYDILSFEKQISDDNVLSKLDIGSVNLLPLLFQTGYLTIKSKNVNPMDFQKTTYELSYPNKEVKDSLLNYLFSSYTNIDIAATISVYLQIYDSLKNEDLPKTVKLLQTMFANIPSKLISKKNKHDLESYYQRVFYIVLHLLNAKISLEVPTDKGFIDAVLEFADKIYVIEFKLDSALKALSQIKERKYYEKVQGKGKKLILLGIGGFKNKKINYKMECLAD